MLAGAVEVESELLQPVITALKARPNSTTKESFFIAGLTFTVPSESTSKYLPHIRRNKAHGRGSALVERLRIVVGRASSRAVPFGALL